MTRLEDVLDTAALIAVADEMARHHFDRSCDDGCDSELDCALAVIKVFRAATRPHGRDCGCTGFDHSHTCSEWVLPL